MNSIIEPDWPIEQIEWAVLPGERGREAGKNARLGTHGRSVPFHVAKITIAGVTGFGWSIISRKEAEAIVGVPVQNVFTDDGKVREDFRSIEFPLFDWLGNIIGRPVYSLISRHKETETTNPFTVPCYDTSLYFDDLHLTDDASAVKWMQAEALEGRSRGHRNFKIKVGRGARHMPLYAGIKRDIEVIRGIREIAGPDGLIMIDANNGYNLNITKEVLAETADIGLYWIEEAFHEDPELYRDLKQWMAERKLQVLVADGEGLAAPPLVNWAQQGLIDVIQYDILRPGFSYWLGLGEILDQSNVKSAPHNYGNPYGQYPLSHLASAIDGFQFVEWDHVHVSGLDTSAYRILDGIVHVPSNPGFGLYLDDSYFAAMLKDSGWSIRK
jgi:L-rhamnonate dehydratase